MKPNPRPSIFRRTIRWVRGGGAAVTALLVVVWIGSVWVGIFRDHGMGTCGVSRGAIVAVSWPASSAPWLSSAMSMTWPRSGWRVRWGTYGGWTWGYEHRSNALAGSSLTVPLWIPSLASLLTTAAAWRLDALARRRDRVARLNLCPKCHYDRAGIGAGAVCPECGSMPA